MRLATISTQGRAVAALEREGRWYELSASLAGNHDTVGSGILRLIEYAADLPDGIEGFVSGLDYARHPLPESAEMSLPYRPRTIVAAGRNYAEHARELDNPVPDTPVLFTKASSSCIGPGEAIRIAEDYGRVDYEGEIALVIGRQSAALNPEDARDAVAGYTLLNDVTARDWQSKAKQNGLPWFLSKSLDTFCPIGPAILLRSAVSWPPAFALTTRVNGDLRQRGHTRDLLFGFGELLAYITRYVRLYPGDVVATGTPAGVGALTPGDVVEVEVPEIGTLRNPVARRDSA